MFTTRRRVAVVLTAAASALSLVALASPAQAISPPLWPTAGRIPTGCASLTLGSGATDWTYSYTDTADASVVDVSINTGTFVVATPAGVPALFRIHVRQPCSGVLGVAAGWKHNGVPVTIVNFPTAPANVFDGWWTSTPGGAARPSDAGYYTFPWAQAPQRWDSFILDGDYKLSSKVDNTPVGLEGLQVGAWATKKLYVLVATTLTPTAPASVKKGKSAKATAVLKIATNAGYVVDAGEKVVVQTKVGTGKWLSNATLTANASGVVSYTFVPSKTTSVRFVHPTTLSGKYSSTSTSAIKIVKVV